MDLPAALQGSQAGTTLGSMVASWLDTVASPQGSFQEGNPPDTDSEMDALLRRSIADMHLSQPKYKTPPKSEWVAFPTTHFPPVPVLFLGHASWGQFLDHTIIAVPPFQRKKKKKDHCC